jgi:hypothetical protein
VTASEIMNAGDMVKILDSILPIRKAEIRNGDQPDDALCKSEVGLSTQQCSVSLSLSAWLTLGRSEISVVHCSTKRCVSTL